MTQQPQSVAVTSGDRINLGSDRYSPGDPIEIHNAIRHLPEVVAAITAKAQEMVQLTGLPDNYEVVVQNEPGTTRARAYAKPTNKGIHQELRDHTLLKTALSMGGR